VAFYSPSLPCKNSRVRKSTIEFWLPLMYSMSKSKTHNIDCHLAKICFEHFFLKLVLHFCNLFFLKSFDIKDHLKILKCLVL
jgi:hypothetical protein